MYDMIRCMNWYILYDMVYEMMYDMIRCMNWYILYDMVYEMMYLLKYMT